MTRAVCPWCSVRLQRYLVAGLDGVWMCPTPACQARQLAHAIVAEGKGGKTCHYVPLPTQVLLYECPARNILWGGQAGPGKSHGVRWWLYTRALKTPGYEALLLRENWDQLETTHLRKMEREVPALSGRYFKSDRKVVFGTGSDEAIIDCGHMAETDAVTRYLSTEYVDIVPDEASLYPVDADGTTPLAELSTRARKICIDREGHRVEPKFVPVTNPGGPSAAWLRDFFIDHTPDFDRYVALKAKYRPEDWAYLPARLDDNPYLDPEYETTLAVLQPWRYEQLRHGDWTVFAGQFFSEWQPRTHVSSPHIPPQIEWFCSQDWGFNAPGVILWWACLADGHYHIAKERRYQYQSAEAVAKDWHKTNVDLGNPKIRYVVGDPSMWAKTGGGRGESIAETQLRCGMPMRPGDNDRKNGWQRCHELLQLAPDGRPWFTVDPSCTYGIRSIPAQLSDSSKGGDLDDIDTGGDDHWVDAWRYGAMSRPSPTRFLKQQKKLHPWLEEALTASSATQPLGRNNVRRRTA
jgi:hypothetical protein